MNKCFDSDDDSSAAPVAGGSTGIGPTASRRQQAPQAKPSELYSDEEVDGNKGQQSPPAPLKVPQFRRPDWQPPPSQLPTPEPAVSNQPPPPVQIVAQNPVANPPLPPQPVFVPQPLHQPPQQQVHHPVQQSTQQPMHHPMQQPAYQPAQYAPPHHQQAQAPYLPSQPYGQPTQYQAPPQQATFQAMPGVAQPPQFVPQPQVVTQQVPPPPKQFLPPVLPQAPEPPANRPIPLEYVPPAPQHIPSSLLTQQAVPQSTESSSWEAFQSLKKQLDESHQRTVALHAQISQIQLTHEKEASAFREAANTQIDVLGKSLEQVTEHYNESQSKIESLTSLLNRKAEQIVKCEQKVHELTVSVAGMTQKVAHMDDRVRLSDGARQIAEVRVRELELTLEHSALLVDTLRRQLSSSHDDKVKAMQQQYELFDKNRQDLIQFFNGREQQLVQQYNVSLKELQGLMEGNTAQREAQITKHWRETVEELSKQHERLQQDMDRRSQQAALEVKEVKEKFQDEKLRLEAQYQKEMLALDQRQREREEHAMADIARRERELGEREAKIRVQRVQDEQDAKISLLTKEAEMKAYYEKIVEDLRRAHDQDRDRLCTAFRDQVTQLSAQHLSNERELERLHREKEREMAQRYRVAGYEVDDKKGQVDLQDVSQKTQSSLLSKFDSIEVRQRERAELTRASLRASTSLSGIGVGGSAGGPVDTAAKPM